MANFVIVHDPNIARRDGYLRQIEGNIAPRAGLVTRRILHPDIGAAWAASPQAPLSTMETATDVAVVWGTALGAGSDQHLDAEGYAALWADEAHGAPQPLDGYHAAFSYHAGRGLAIGADLLGLFPIYYWVNNDILLAGSSCELICRYPAFRPAIDHEGLVGLLMTHGPLGGRTLLEGIRRLQAGHVLRRSSDGRTREVLQYTIPNPSALAELTFDDQVDALGNALQRAVRRHVARRSSIGLLLSGGRDTRLLGGYLRESGCSIDALTFGLETDYEVRCARAVGRALGAAHRVASVPETVFPECAQSQVTWGHLGSGFSTVHTWGMIDELASRGAPIVAGYVVGRMVGGTSMISQNGPYGQSIPFDTAYPLCAGVTVPQSTLRELMGGGRSDGAIDTVLARMQHDYETEDTVETQRVWRYVLYHFERFHAGGVPWHLSFGTWPILPLLDQELLATIGHLHPWSLANRRAQDELLCRRFPDLAHIILDRNAHNIEPLRPTVAYRTRRQIRGLLSRAGLQRRSVPDGIEPRYYYRMYDLNGPGWRAIRELAEPHREALGDLFDLDAVRAYLPPPDQTIEMKDTIVDGSGRKLLLGLMLWRGRLGI